MLITPEKYELIKCVYSRMTTNVKYFKLIHIQSWGEFYAVLDEII